jgi:hypothetical protein
LQLVLLTCQYPNFTAVNNSRSMSETFYRLIALLKGKAGCLSFKGLPICNHFFCLSLHITKNTVWLNYKNYSLPVCIPTENTVFVMTTHRGKRLQTFQDFMYYYVLICPLLNKIGTRQQMLVRIISNMNFILPKSCIDI